MEISVKQRSMTCITGLWCVVLVLLVLGHGVYADQKYSKDANEQPGGKSDPGAKDANDPNELWRSYDTVVKDPNDANELLEAKWHAIVTVLRNKDLDQKLKEKIIDKINSPIFDSSLMAKLALGREHWAELNEQQRDKFTQLFVDRLNIFYLEKITHYKDEKVLFKPAMQKKNTIHIPVVLISNGKDIVILYKLHKMDEQRKDKVTEHWTIYDVEVEGVSVLLTYRSQFDDILRRGGVKELFFQLEKPPTQ